MKYRSIMALALAAALVLPMGAMAEETTNITLWTYPIGNWGDAATVDTLIASFEEAHPEISVTVEYLDYTNGDDQVNTAIEGGQAPDLVMEGPERLVANWGAKGLMVDLSDLWTDEAKEAIYDSVEAACQNNDGVFYEYPLCMTAHTMAINRDLFEVADALQYIDESLKELDGGIMFLMDVDNFKKINDTYGHMRGDEVLIKVSVVLRELFRKGDIIGRFGGDEFIQV